MVAEGGEAARRGHMTTDGSGTGDASAQFSGVIGVPEIRILDD